MAKRILVVDDEPDIVNLLRDYFELNQYTVMTASNGADAVAQSEKQPDLILLDINMPGMDGLAVCRRIRDFVSCPILFLTAKVEDSDKISGFQAGGDDYIVKPFSLSELGARVEAHLRREERRRGSGRVRFGGELSVDYGERTVYFKGEPVALAKKEFDILELLTMNQGQIFDKERIYEKVWGYDSEGDSSVVAEHIRRLRARLAAAGCGNRIDTVWGVGYKWVK
ncbi:response regulator transcription factor [Bacilliculturomica massiliensis]|uniref:response regulator transcription factor n=1 Tax=Bacilliculturomica massiliensis TaxID=1917867 RepID=UPI0010315B34|nr:response regulator transcription factor [Bacilliculturomica massiliensis]